MRRPEPVPKPHRKKHDRADPKQEMMMTRWIGIRSDKNPMRAFPGTEAATMSALCFNDYLPFMMEMSPTPVGYLSLIHI